VDRLPEVSVLHFELALVYAERGLSQSALAELERSVELDPAFARAWYNLGLARRDQGDPEGALRALARAEDLAATPAEAAYASALLLRDLGRFEAAREAALRALAADPEPRSVRVLLQALERRTRTP